MNYRNCIAMALAGIIRKEPTAWRPPAPTSVPGSTTFSHSLSLLILTQLAISLYASIFWLVKYYSIFVSIENIPV